MTIPKIVNFYWGRTSLPYLRYLTVTSFIKFNPEWEIRVHYPNKDINPKLPWKTIEHKSSNYTGGNYWGEIENNPTIQKFEVKFSDSIMSDVHRSDLLRWNLLSTTGGIWSDLDIIYIKPIPENILQFDTLVCIGPYGHSIGFLGAAQNNKVFKTMREACNKSYRKEDYQSIGAPKLNELFPAVNSMEQAYNLPMSFVYPIDANSIQKIYNGSVSDIPKESIGLHWYAGHPISSDYMNKIGPDWSIEKNLLGKAIAVLREMGI